MNDEFNWNDYPEVDSKIENKESNDEFNWNDYEEVSPEPIPENPSLFSKATDSLEAGARSIVDDITSVFNNTNDVDSSKIKRDEFGRLTPESLAYTNQKADEKFNKFKDIIKKENESDTSRLEALARGGVRAATFELADEASGAGEAVLNKLAGNPTDITELYKKYRDESRANFKKADEDRPFLSGAGQVAGGLIPAAFTGGGSAAASIGTQGLKQAIPRLAAAGAIEGGLYGLGQSEQESLGGLAMDTALSAGLGATAAVGVPSAIEGIKAIPSLAGKTVSGISDMVVPNLTKHSKQAYELGKKGIEVSGEAAETALRKDTLEVANKIKNTLKNRFDTASSKLGDILESAGDKDKYKSFAVDLEKAIEENPTMDTKLKNHLKGMLDNFKVATENEKVISGLDVAEDRLNKALEKARGRNEITGKMGDVYPVDPTDEGNFLQGINARLNKSGNVTNKQAIQVAVPEDKIINESTREFSDVSLSDLYNYKKELGNMLENPKLDYYDGLEVKKELDKLNKFINSSLSKTDTQDLALQNSIMKDVHDLGDISKPLGRSSQFDKDADLKIQNLLTGKDENTIDRFKQYIGKGNNLPNDIDDIRTRKELLNEANRDTQGVFDITRKLTKSGTIRVANYAGKVKKVMDNQAAKSRLIQKAQALGDAKIVKLLSTPVTAENRSKLMFSLSQQPVFRNLIDEEEEVEE